jgi:peptide chain release factor 2
MVRVIKSKGIETIVPYSRGEGRQIRVYVLSPYQLVRDIRTGEETTDTMSVLEGDLDQFLRAALIRELLSK